MISNFFKTRLWLLSLSVFLVSISFNTKADIAVIAHPGVNVEQVNIQTLTRIYAMQVRSWPSSSSPIRAFSFHTQSAEFRNFSTNSLNMPPHQLERLWDRLTFTGTGRAPTRVNSQREMLNVISATPGAIGYIELPADLSGVKVLEVLK